MHIQRHDPEALGAPLGLYSHVTRVKADEFIHVAGQLHDGPDLHTQCAGVFGQIGAALHSAGADWSHVVQFTTYLTHESLIEPFMAWRAAHFPRLFGGGPYPPNTLLVVRRLVDERYFIEVQTIAAL